MSTKWCSFAIVMIAAFATAGPSVGTANAQGGDQQVCDKDKIADAMRDRVAADLNHLAQELSVLVAQEQPRRQIAEKLSGAKQRALSLHLVLSELGQAKAEQQGRSTSAEQDAQQANNSSEVRSSKVAQEQGEDQRMPAILETVRKIESVMMELGVATPRLDLKLPVAAHAKAIGEAAEVYVAVAPLEDEDQVRTVTAFAGGKQIALDAKTPPEVPTLVLVGAEPQSDDPGYPLPQAKEPGQEENPREVDDYVGLPWMFLFDDHESWPCGDPEIYVRIKRFRFSTFSILDDKINLPGVNGERVWHNLGDPNSTYRFVSTSDYAPVVRIEVWEEDNGFHGGDDFLGAINITWTQLAFGGYQYFTAGDARFGIDRD